MDADELLAIGAALVQTVRSQIKYSENIPALYLGYKNSYLYKNSMGLLSRNNYCGYNPNELGKSSIDQGVGCCDELSLACMYIAKGLKEIKIDKFYLSLVNVGNKHVFILAHCSKISLIQYLTTGLST